MKTRRLCFTMMLIIPMFIITSCGGSQKSGNGILNELVGLYMEICQKNEEMTVLGNALNYKEISIDEYNSKGEQIMNKMEILIKKSEELAPSYIGKDFPCSASAEAGITISEGKIVHCVGGFKGIAVIEMKSSAPGYGTCYMFSLDKNDRILSQTKGFYSHEDPTKITISTHFSAFGMGSLDQKMEMLKYQGSISKLLVVSMNEYNAGVLNVTNSKNTEPESQEYEGEPIYLGNDEVGVKSATIQGKKIKVNDPIVESLSKLNDIIWQYNADSEELISCYVDDTSILIYDEDVTKEGIDFINSLLSDMDDDVKFSLKYIKPNAKIKKIIKY